VTTSLFYNNCAQTKSSVTGETLAFMSETEKVEKLKADHSSTLDSNFCENSQNYSCRRKIFSAAAESLKPKTEAHCFQLLKSGNEFCLSLPTQIYNSSSAQEACDGNCSEQYEFTEYDCHLKLSPLGTTINPLIVSTQDLKSSVEKIYQSCLRLTHHE
jgi:hypothetical protein